MSSWPAVSPPLAALPAHASNLKTEIQELLKYGQSHGENDRGTVAKPIPFDVFKSLSDSVLALVNKVLDQPSLKDLAEAIERVNQTTKTILTDVQAAPEPSTAAVAVSAIDAVPEDTPESLGFAPQMVERMKSMPPETVQKLMDAKRRGNALLLTRTQAAGGTASSKPIPSKVTARSSAQHGGSSKIVLESQGNEEIKVHGKIYTPLSKAKREIRVVKVFPDLDPTYGIRCELSVVSLDAKPVYKALSYTWGNPNDSVPITLNGQRFPVTRNLKKALERLRTLDTETPIWIDAICINQVDSDERMHQVQMMRVIFESPSEVIIWLGDLHTLPGDELWDTGCFDWRGDESDIPSINSIIEFTDALADTYPQKSDPRSANPLMFGLCVMRLLAGDVHLADIPLLRNIHLRQQCLAAFSNLVMQPWWNRIWVVQEVILPSRVTIVFGRFKAPLRMYADASSNLERHKSSCCAGIIPADDRAASSVDDFCRKMLTIVESGNLWRKRDGITLLTLLRLYYPKDATDARDKIYGLLGLVTDWGNSKAIAPNYTITASELYQEVAQQSVAISGTLSILTFRTERMYHRMLQDINSVKNNVIYHKRTTDSSNPTEKYLHRSLHEKFKSSIPDPVELDIPSWVPDWETINEKGFERQTAERINRAFLFNACASRPAPPAPVLHTASPVLKRTRVLAVSGVRVGVVEKIDFPYLVASSQALSVDKISLPSNPGDLTSTPYVGGGDTYTALWRTLVADSFFLHSSRGAAGLDGRAMFRRASSADLPAIQAWRRWLSRQKSIGIHKAPVLKDFENAEEHALVSNTDRAVRSAVLQRSYFVTNTGYMGLGGGAQPGDEVWVLMGARTPQVLRPVGSVGVEGVGEREVWINVGEAYVQGVMDGEVVKGENAEVKEILLL
ncbi:hypothetical protein K432DRAFT_435624 [Lepidopterella palustris CBS 459.81]|uniref:Heterokaryon incompatibility domain-containing protein n=1 Tax=Lepidopterella palustris CBS 459.81 TaxID=1314670 RepID=A0A8E2E7Y4_9PEZI|nr:hypothetical protein K432DRAFT_435624 [Lepidopterella palustris CBS 459.81]